MAGVFVGVKDIPDQLYFEHGFRSVFLDFYTKKDDADMRRPTKPVSFASLPGTTTAMNHQDTTR